MLKEMQWACRRHKSTGNGAAEQRCDPGSARAEDDYGEWKGEGVTKKAGALVWWLVCQSRRSRQVTLRAHAQDLKIG